MKKKRPLISSNCPLYACRVCRTKTGWPHQLWCELGDVIEPTCSDCCYWNKAEDACRHPAV